MYRYVSTESLNFYCEYLNEDAKIQVWSHQIAKFFNINHINYLMPILKDLRSKNHDSFIPVHQFNNEDNTKKIAFFVLNKEGCEILCKNIKTKPSLKKQFLLIINRLI